MLFVVLLCHNPQTQQLRTVIAPRITSGIGFLSRKRSEAARIVQDLVAVTHTKSGSALFDAYVALNYLDNTLRGGAPIMLGSKSDALKTYYAFSRIHGDMERDYNYFILEPQYFSFGPGMYDAVMWL